MNKCRICGKKITAATTDNYCSADCQSFARAFNQQIARAEMEMSRVHGLESEVKILQSLLRGARGTIIMLLGYLPDSKHPENSSWLWCWEQLNDSAQESVKAVRRLAEIDLQRLDGDK